jgi:hypothetical protein
MTILCLRCGLAVAGDHECRRVPVECTGGGEWYIVDLTEEPCDFNYYGVVADGFDTLAKAFAYIRESAARDGAP